LAVVCGWEYFTDWLAYGLCAWKRLPYLLYTDEDVRHPGLTRMKTARRAALGALCKRAAGALYTGTLNRDFYIRAGVEPERLWFSPWAVDNGRFGRAKRADARRELGLKPETVYLLFVGKLIERKRPSHLLEVACRLQREGLRVGALVVGSGTLEADLRTRIRDSGLADCHLLGFRNQSELPAIYAAADAFVLPSVRDPRATVVNEAMAAGLPVVITTGTQLWGPGDLVSQGVEGFVVRPDELDGLTEACRTLTDSTRRLEMAAAARARIANWSYDTAVLGWLAAARTIACPREALPEFGPDSRLANA
jgi:glycosyltransferase involved in cell wall biosynthesis